MDSPLERGRTALAACDWETAAAAYEVVLASAASPHEAAEAADGLGQARYWLADYHASLELLERAFAGYGDDGHPQEAAVVAIRLALLHSLVWGNVIAARAWVGHAVRLARDTDESVVHAWVQVLLGCVSADPEERRRYAMGALETARRVGAVSLEFDALAYVGKSYVETGEVPRGMAMIDEAVAAVASGVVDDVWAAGEIYCVLFHACEMVGDVERARAWLGAVDHYVERTGERPISAICRMHFGAVLTHAGDWDEAERQLETAYAIYGETYVGTRFEAAARLADLRVRQGRLAEAAELLEEHAEHAVAAAPVARLHLARGQPALAEARLERHLAARGRGLLSVEELTLLVEVLLARGDVAAAREVAEELARLAEVADTSVVSASAATASGHVAVAGGDHETAAREYGRAIAAYARAGRPVDVARARLGLAEASLPRRPEVAAAEADAAAGVFETLGVEVLLDRATRVSRAARGGDVGVPGLTTREVEVLRLVADGLSNQDIADRLVLSVRTVEHHVSNVLTKLGAANRTEAAARLRSAPMPRT